MGRVEDFKFLILIPRHMTMFFVHSRVGINVKQIANAAPRKVIALFEKAFSLFWPPQRGHVGIRRALTASGAERRGDEALIILFGCTLVSKRSPWTSINPGTAFWHPRIRAVYMQPSSFEPLGAAFLRRPSEPVGGDRRSLENNLTEGAERWLRRLVVFLTPWVSSSGASSMH